MVPPPVEDVKSLSFAHQVAAFARDMPAERLRAVSGVRSTGAPVPGGRDDIMVNSPPHVPVYRPRLPSAAAIGPYLETLDRTRTYSNHGALERQFAARISRLFGFDTPVTATASSGTAALAGAILAGAGRASGVRDLCLCPAYTFVATAAAVEQCGYRLHFIDVDEKTWQADPDALLAHPALPQVGLVVPVAAYGRAVPQEAWQRFQSLTGIPVVIDGAASSESLADSPERHFGPIPVALSFHATKAFATGEGQFSG